MIKELIKLSTFIVGNENMKKLVLLSICVLSLLINNKATALEFTPILDIVNTETNEPATLYLKTQQDSLSELKLITTKRTAKFSFNEVNDGATLLKKSGINIITIRGINLNPKTGGNIKLTYLKNFSITGSKYGTIWLKIQNDQGSWNLVNGREQVSTILLTPHPFGISSYEFQ